MKVTTTFEQLHTLGACRERYRVLAKALGGVSKYGRTKPIDARVVLKHCGYADTSWFLCSIERYDVLPKTTDYQVELHEYVKSPRDTEKECVAWEKLQSKKAALLRRNLQ